MPYQVSWQSVSMKSQTPVHVLGADADGVEDVPAGDLVATASAAHAPVAAPAAAKIVAANMPSFVMAAPCLRREHPDVEKGNHKTESGMTRKSRFEWPPRHSDPEGELIIRSKNQGFAP
jgi:hypothetical protein